MTNQASQYLEKKFPKLRFPGFDEEWKNKTLSEVATIERGRFSPRPRNDPQFYGGKIPFVQTGDVVKSNGIIKNYTQTLNEEGLKVSKLFPKGSVLITIAANIGYTGILSEDMACPDSLIGIKCNSSIDNVFLNYYLSMQQPKMDRIASEAAQKNINIEFLRPYPITVTTLPEQQKIAVFLSTIDEWLENLREQKQELEIYKKSMMQKLFSQEIRFKDENGKVFSDWVNTTLGEMFMERTERCGDKKYIMLTVKTNGGISKQDTLARRDNSSKDKRNYKIVRKGDIAYNTMRMWQGASGVSEDEGIVSPAYTVVSLLKGDIYFFGYLFKHPKTIFNFYRYSQGLTSDTWNLKFNHFAEIKVKVPSNTLEQQKIANFLATIDSLLVAKINELAEANLWKKGLMLKMFT